MPLEQENKLGVKKMTDSWQCDGCGPQKQFYPADLFILVSFDSKGQTIKEPNPHWYDEDGFFIGGSEK